MRAGQINRRITIERNTAGRDAAGAETESWTTLADMPVWAEVRPAAGREFFDAQQIIAEAKVVFRIRFRSDVDHKMRVNYDGNLYDIHSIAEIDRRKALDIMTTAKVA